MPGDKRMSDGDTVGSASSSTLVLVRLETGTLLTYIFTSAKDVMEIPAFICLFVCQQLNVKTTERIFNLHENFTTDVSVHKEELVNFWKPSASGSGSRNS